MDARYPLVLLGTMTLLIAWFIEPTLCERDARATGPFVAVGVTLLWLSLLV